MTQMHYVDENNRLSAAPSPRWYATPKRIRAFFGGEAVADSTNAHLLREGGPPIYYFPESDVRTDLLEPSSLTKDSPVRGTASYWSINAGGRQAQDAAYTYKSPVEGAEFLVGHIAFEWGKMDAWFEEKEEVYVHARDPFKRIDTLKTDRHVQVIVGGETVADSDESVLLLEPGHPFRYYIPKADVRMELLRPSDTVSKCAYKGAASYYSMEVGGNTHEDVVWAYPYPTPEVGKVAGMLCFYNERVDQVIVDGKPQEKPQTPWRR